VVPGEESGVLAVHSRAPRTFAPEEVGFLKTVANLLATAIGRNRAEQQIRHQALHDPLTGLPNRELVTDRLAHALAQCERRACCAALLFLDLDHFKVVNDTHGHPFGDGVLREFARRLQDCLREVDTVTRYGGEEFTVVLPETGAEGAAAVAGRIVRAVRDQPFAVGNRSAEVTVSAGVAAFPDHGRTASEILRAADAALYAAKGAGRDRWCLAEISVPGAPGDDLLEETLGEGFGTGGGGTLSGGQGPEGAVQGVGAARPGRAG
jgi:diguanylate cyclase (GGDEF)-like protein